MISRELTLFFVWCFLRATPARAAKERYYEKNKGICKARAKAHRLTEVGKLWMRQWQNRKHKSEIAFRLEKNIRTRIWYALEAKSSKSARTEELLGCSVSELKAHLARQFSPEMSWENYGSMWEIDHRIP